MPKRSPHTPASDDARIGVRLKDVRLARGLDQKAVAAQLGMDQSVLSRYERGILRLPSSLLAQIARALKISTDAILGLKDVKPGMYRPLRCGRPRGSGLRGSHLNVMGRGRWSFDARGAA